VDYYVAIASIIGIHTLLGLSVYLVAISGQMSFGQQGFFAIGAYLAGMSTALWGIPLLPALVLGAMLAGAMGFLVGFPALRVRGLYLAIATFGFGEIVRLAFLNVRYTKDIGGRIVGPNGSEGFRHVRYVFDRGFTSLHYLGIIVAAVAVVAVLYYLLERSKLGARLRAVEEDETAAAMVGINVTRVKVFAFAAAGAVAGLGGGLFIHYSTYIDHDMVALPLAIASVTYPLLGGLGSFVGPILGAVVLVSLTEGLRVLHELREFVYGALIILTMLFRPRGIVDEALVLRVKAWFQPRAARPSDPDPVTVAAPPVSRP
jgi:branched-chain amino acid transport system permease protein